MIRKLIYQIGLALLDVALVSLAFYLSYAMRFDFSIPEGFVVQIRELMPIVILAYLGALLYFGLHRGMWCYAGIADMVSILKAVSLGTALLIVVDFSQNYTAGLSFASLFFIVAIVGQAGGGRFWRFVKRQELPVLLALIPLFILLLYPVFKTILAPFIPASIGIGEWFNSHFIAARTGDSAKIPRSVVTLNWILSLLFIGGSRVGCRLWREHGTMRPSETRRVLVVGAGDAGEQVMREMRRNRRIGYHPVGFIDDDPRKKGRRIHGVQVLGTRHEIKRIVEEYHIGEIVIAIPSVRGERLKQLVECCQIPEVQLRILPGIRDLIDGKIRVSSLREVSPEDLLDRDEVQVDMERISGYLTGKTVLVTGAGGSIGSELCRQIATYEPERLLLLGAGENSIYEIQMELNTRFPRLNKIPVIGNIRDERRIGQVFEQYHPEIVFHAAAHKHVPLMELNPNEAVKNNILGTRNVAQAALRYGVGKFVFISTDKAVNPTSVMGASKRIAELLIHKLARKNQTRFVVVRFGNVLGSRGSVIPLFKKQIGFGGPVTVTHPEVTRYFMTIPEAAQLVIQSGALGKGGEIFVLDMGEQLKIAELARNLIRLSGLEPDKDIRIAYIGLRPGEKLYEEVLTASEGTIATRHEKIFISRSEDVDDEKLTGAIEKLEKYARNGSSAEIIRTLKELIPTYIPYECSGA